TTSLRGIYITAEDVGTTPPDLASVFETTRFATCVPPTVGGSGNPSPATAKGVVCAMEAALDHQGKGSLAGKTVAMQGAGNVATYMIDELLARDIGKVVATEISPERCALLRERFAGKPVEIRSSEPGDRLDPRHRVRHPLPVRPRRRARRPHDPRAALPDRLRRREQHPRRLRRGRRRPQGARHRLRARLRRQPHGHRQLCQRAVRQPAP
ncbi:MAG: hypothetical protein KC457_22300, partial [Myxococcales bacterium]|nr:hypothetical protein [Myxococcales bacterium]